MALQIFSAQRFGFGISDPVAAEIAWGDVLGACLALVGLWLLYAGLPGARLVLWLFVVESEPRFGSGRNRLRIGTPRP